MKTTNSVDVLAGKRLRAFRVNKGLSQTEVGEAVGVTFQQIQKYENGSNRISASRLQQLATLLDVRVADFFAEKNSKSSANDIIIESPLEQRLIAAFRGRKPELRAQIVQLLEIMGP